MELLLLLENIAPLCLGVAGYIIPKRNKTFLGKIEPQHHQ